MKSLRHLFTAVVALLISIGFVAGCSGPVTTPTKTLASIAVMPASPARLKVGSTQQFTATGTYSDSSTADITSTVTWASGTTATATISSAGLATGVAAGTTSITATLGTVVSPGVTLTVIALTSIDVTPHSPSTIAIAATQQFTATGKYTDASTSDISSQVAWSCLPAATATISTTGLATGVANGTAQVSASLQGITSNSVTLTVGTGGVPVPVAVKIQQQNPTIPVGGVEDFSVKILFSDGSLHLPTAAVTWNSSDTTKATISSTSGIATGVAPGTTTIGASSAGLASDSTILTVKATVARFVYTTGPTDGVVASFAINSSAAALTPISSLDDRGTALQLVFEPSGHFAYSVGFDGAIRIYAIDSTSGNLTQSTVPAGIPAGGLPSFVPSVTSVGESVVDPSGRYLYVVDTGTGFVNAFSIKTDSNAADFGDVAVIGASPKVATGLSPFGAAVTPDGGFLYVTNTGDSTISAYKIAGDGSLSSPIVLSASVAAALNVPEVPSIDPSGQFLYVPNGGATPGTVTAFKIAADGTLTVLGTGPVDAGTSPFGTAVDPAGKFLFVTNSGDGTVTAFPVNADGSLGTALAAVNSGSGTSSALTAGIAVDRSGTFAVTVNNGENSATFYSLSNGVLTAKFTAETSAIPLFPSFYQGTASPTIGPLNVFAANSGSANLSGFVATASTGALGAATISVGQSGNNSLAADLSGGLLYSTSASSKTIGAFTANATSAALTAFASSPFQLSTAIDAPSDVAAEPTSRAIFVADTTGNKLEAFSTGTTLTSLGALSFASVNGMAVDPQATYIVALGNNNITSAGISGFTGALEAGGPTNTITPTGNWVSGAIDPTGHWLVALDSAGKNLQAIAVSPVQNQFLAPPPPPPVIPADGALTVTGPIVPTGLVTPSSVTFDALGRFVFVSDATAGKIAVFSFNESTGALAALGAPVTVDATGTGKVAVDASGTYLYAAVKGNGGSVPSAVAAYTINSTNGALTALAGSPFAAGTGTSGTAGVAVTSSVK